MDLMIFLIILVIVVLVFKDTRSLIYFLGISDILLKLIHFIKVQIDVEEFTTLINKYIPSSLMGIAANYTEGFVYTIFAWLYIIVMCWFVGYLLKYLFNL